MPRTKLPRHPLLKKRVFFRKGTWAALIMSPIAIIPSPLLPTTPQAPCKYHTPPPPTPFIKETCAAPFPSNPSRRVHGIDHVFREWARVRARAYAAPIGLGSPPGVGMGSWWGRRWDPVRRKKKWQVLKVYSILCHYYSNYIVVQTNIRTRINNTIINEKGNPLLVHDVH